MLYMLPGLDTNGCPIARGNRFQVGASEKFQSVAPWAIASIFTILNLSDCHNRQRMSLASRESDKLGGQVPQKFSCQLVSSSGYHITLCYI